jgi:hypothetical protein
VNFPPESRQSTRTPGLKRTTNRQKRKKARKARCHLHLGSLRPSSLLAQCPPTLEAWRVIPDTPPIPHPTAPWCPVSLAVHPAQRQSRAHPRPTGVLVPRPSPRVGRGGTQPEPRLLGRPTSRRAAQNSRTAESTRVLSAYAPRLLGTAQCECDGRPLVSDKGRAQPPPAAASAAVARCRRRRSLSVCRCRRRHQPRRERQPSAFLVARPRRDTASIAATISKLH